MITVTIKKPDIPASDIGTALREGLDAAGQLAAKIQQENAPVRTGTLRRSIYGDFTGLDNFKAMVVQDAKVAPYGPIVNDGYDGFILPNNAKALKIHLPGNKTIFRPYAMGQKAQNFWEKINDHVDELTEAAANAIQKFFGG